MKTFRKAIAVLLLMSVILLPASGLASGFDTLKTLVEMEFSDTIPAPEGYSIYNDVESETDNGVLCVIIFGDESNSIMISGINGNGKYEIALLPISVAV